VQEDISALYYPSEELLGDKLFLIKCYKIRKLTTYYNDFIKEFDQLENGQFNDDFIKENVDILDLVENKEQLCEYLFKRKKYKIIYGNEEITEYIKDKYKVKILSYGIIDPLNEHDRVELEKEHKNINIGFQVIFIL